MKEALGDDSMVDRDLHSPLSDGLRFRLVEREGRLMFDSVSSVPGPSRQPRALCDLLSLLEGAWLDELDLDYIESVECCEACAVGTSVAQLIRELRELLTT